MKISIIGAGLAGCECALFLANNGFEVDLYEQKPQKYSAAHKNKNFAELVCSNSLKSDRIDSASGMLKGEMQLLGSQILPIAQTCRVPAGGALAVDRDKFAQSVTDAVLCNNKINVHKTEVLQIEENDSDKITIIATGPLTQGAFATDILRLTGRQSLAFYDAAAPIITAQSLDVNKIFAQSRYDKGEADYLNCPFNKEQYEQFYELLVNAQTADLHDFDKNGECEEQSGKKIKVYEGCMPIEEMAKRGADTMRYGPLRPVGLKDPRTGHRPWANVQLRAENIDKTMYNIVGFHTNLKFAHQKQVFSTIPGLENAEFVRYGVMHRNTFINSPEVLSENLSLKKYKNIFFAGQITGFEGYMESVASGLLAAHFAMAHLQGKKPLQLPQTTMCGALLNYITQQNKDFQPMGANMGLLPVLENHVRDKRLRYKALTVRALSDLAAQINTKDSSKMLSELLRM